MNTIQISQGYTFHDLRAELSRIRGSEMPQTTLYNWLRRLKISPGRDGLYSTDDLYVLKDLNRFLQRCPSIKKFERAYFS